MDKRLHNNYSYLLIGARGHAWPGKAAAALASLFIVFAALAPQAYGQATISGGSFTTDLENTEFDHTGTFELFDSNLGNLLGVRITFTGEVETQITVSNASDAGSTASGQAQTRMGLWFESDNQAINDRIYTEPTPIDLPDGPLDWNPGLGINQSFNFNNLAPGNSVSSGTMTNDGDMVVQITPDVFNDLAEFMAPGGGQFDVTCFSGTALVTSAQGGNVESSQSTQGSCGFEIEYIYEPVTTIEITEGPCWRTLSSPVEQTWAEFFASFDSPGGNFGGLWTQGAPGARTTAGQPNVYTMNADGTNWVPVTNLDATIPAGTGVAISVFDLNNPDNPASGGFPKTAQFTGDLGRSATVDFGTYEGTTTSSGGFSMLGNPWETAIDFNELDASGIENAAWVYDRNSGQWISTNGTSGDLAQGLIAAGQGFVVQNSSSGSPSVTIGEEAKVYEVVDFYGKEVQKPDHFRIEVRGEEGVYNSAWVELSHNGTFNEIIRGDVAQFYPYEENYAVLSTVKLGEMMDIGHFPYPDQEQTSIPLTVETTSTAPMTLTLTDLQIGISAPLYLHDTVTGESVELAEGMEYTFTPTTSGTLAKAVDGCLTVPSGLTRPAGLAKAASPRFLVNANASLNDGGSDLPATFSLDQNYPNPFNPTTQITYQLPEQAQVTLSVYDMAGRHVSTLVNNESINAGTHTVNFDASSLSSGVYMYRLNAGSTVLTRKLTLIK